MRCAIYFVPPADDPLTVAAAQWLRRDIYTGARLETEIGGLTADDHAFLTALPRRYGFHATLKAPFRLAEGKTVAQVERHLAQFSAMAAPISFAYKVSLLESFFAFTPAEVAPAVGVLAAELVTEFDSYRMPLTEIDLARRGISRLDSGELSNLMNWGYPHVFDRFRFHMTLTGPIDHMERDHVAQVLDHHFGTLAAGVMELRHLALAVEPEPNGAFVVHSVHPLARQRERRIA